MTRKRALEVAAVMLLAAGGPAALGRWRGAVPGDQLERTADERHARQRAQLPGRVRAATRASSSSLEDTKPGDCGTFLFAADGLYAPSFADHGPPAPWAWAPTSGTRR